MRSPLVVGVVVLSVGISMAVFGVDGLVIVIAAPVALTLAVLAWITSPVITPRSHVARSGGRGVCGACGYALAGLRAEEESGLTVCPECGAAWRLPADRGDRLD